MTAHSETPSAIRVTRTRPVLSRGARTLGYELSREGAPHVVVTRTEEELKAFHKLAVGKLAASKLGVDARSLEQTLDFPLKEYKTGFELLPGLVFVGSLAAGVTQSQLDPVPAAGFALALSSLVMLLVMAFGMARLPVTWAGPKRVAPVQAYLNRVAKQLAVVGEERVVDALLEPPLVADWPSRIGDIDLAVHDLPHDSAATEWWYYNSHVTARNVATGEVKPLSVFASFFRVAKHDDGRGNKQYGHALTWAVSDPSAAAYHFDVALDPDAPRDVLRAIESSESVGPADAFLRRALLDVLRKGAVPLPDRLMSRAPVVSATALDLDLDGSTLVKDDATGDYLLQCANATGELAATLRFSPQKPAVRHGDHGVVRGHDGEGEDMFYYFVPRCAVTGTVTIPVRDKPGLVDTFEVVEGQGWYDHEFGGMIKPAAPPPKRAKGDDAAAAAPAEKERDKMDYAWNWVAAQLDDGSEVTAAVLLDSRAKRVIETKAVLVAADGARSQFDEASGAALVEVEREKWVSMRTFRAYPLAFRLTVPAAGVDLLIKAAFPDQEFMTLLSKPAFWEGRCDVTGVVRGRAVTGLAYLERNGFDPNQGVHAFFKSVGVAVRESVERCYPLQPTLEEAVTLCASEDTRHFMDDVPLDILGKNLMGPVRLIADRGGKSWRSYAALACVDAVGGDSRRYVQWLAFPEFLHVGSLIIDDIQDRSAMRRGGPAAHFVYGEPLSINAGTAAYFQCEKLIDVPWLSEATRLQCYQLFFLALRAGHAGQCLDITGNDYMMAEVVRAGDASLLERRILAIHRLKTAAPAGTLARLGATVGGGSKEQIEAVGLFMESVGVAFQIMDDVLNVRGVVAKSADKLQPGTLLKTLGEDLSEGKCTYPVAKFLGKSKDEAERRRVWSTIESKPQDRAVVDALIADLERVGAVEECIEEARRIVDEAWERVDRVIPDSFSKSMLRAFALYVVEGQ